MLVTPHVITGVALGKTMRLPWAAMLLAFASHFLLDMMPHLDEQSLFGLVDGQPLPLRALIMAAIDVLIAILLVGWLVRRRADRWRCLGAALAAIVIDMVDNVPPICTYFQHWWGTAWLSAFHAWCQGDVAANQLFAGFFWQILVVVIGVGVTREWQVRATLNRLRDATLLQARWSMNILRLSRSSAKSTGLALTGEDSLT